MGQVEIHLATGFDEAIARMVAPHVTNLAKQVAVTARRTAPPVKEWETRRDDRVRPTHVATDRQRRPANLRFALPSTQWDIGIGREPDREAYVRALGVDYFDHPGEHLEWARGNYENCRCRIVWDPTGLARHVQHSDAVVTGTVARATVWVTAPHAVGAELGELYPTPYGAQPAEGTYFMRKAAWTVATRSRARQ